MVKKCQNCGTPAVDEQALFCNKCGSKIPEEQKTVLPVCKNCGTTSIDEQALFCNKCGTPLKNTTNAEIQIVDKPPRKQDREPVINTSKKYAHIPLEADNTKGKYSFHDEKISFDKTEPLPKRGSISTKQIQETRCTCLACGKVWHYGKSEVYGNYAAMCRNAGKTVSACTCCWPMSYMSREKTDINKCPSCGSNAVKKEQIVHEVE